MVQSYCNSDADCFSLLFGLQSVANCRRHHLCRLNGRCMPVWLNKLIRMIMIATEPSILPCMLKFELVKFSSTIMYKILKRVCFQFEFCNTIFYMAHVSSCLSCILLMMLASITIFTTSILKSLGFRLRALFFVVLVLTYFSQCFLVVKWNLHIEFQGEQKSPGVIPLTIKNVFGIIQEVMDYFIVSSNSIQSFLSLESPCLLFQTPDREFLLRVSYLEIYNEVSLFIFQLYVSLLFLGG